MLLPPEQRPKVSELKHSIVDVKCVDAAGTTYVVEMQVLNVEAFEKRVVYNVAKAYTNQLAKGLSQLQFVFLELPKYAAGNDPQTLVDKWAYFFREAPNLLVIPDSLRHPPLLDALEGARTARFSREEWDAYIAAGMAIQNERGALSLARKEGLIKGIEALCSALGIPLDSKRQVVLQTLDLPRAEALLEHLSRVREWPSRT